MVSRVRISKQLELSLAPGSVVVTDSSNEQMYLPPGDIGEILSIDALGEPNWQPIGTAPGDVPTNNLLQALYPVGSVYISGSATMPGLISMIGTWVELKGRVIVGVDTTQLEFNTVNKVGGFKTHTLTVGEMPSHQHSIARGNYNPNTVVATDFKTINANDGYGATGFTGGNGEHNNLQPYKTKYMWERTA